MEKDFIQFIAKITDHVQKNKCSKQTHSKTAFKNRGWPATSCIRPERSTELTPRSHVEGSRVEHGKQVRDCFLSSVPVHCILLSDTRNLTPETIDIVLVRELNRPT